MELARLYPTIIVTNADTRVMLSINLGASPIPRILGDFGEAERPPLPPDCPRTGFDDLDVRSEFLDFDEAVFPEEPLAFSDAPESFFEDLRLWPEVDFFELEPRALSVLPF